MNRLDYEEYNQFCNEFKDFIVEQYKKQLCANHESDDVQQLNTQLINATFDDVPDSLKVDLYELYKKNKGVVTELYV